MKKMLTTSLVLVASLFAAVTVAANSKSTSPYPLGERSVFSDRATAERIRPVGQVCVAGEECGVAAPAAEEVASGPRSGQQVYDSVCAACHTTGAAGAPKIGDAAEWASRMQQGRDTVIRHSIEGFNAMPPRGMCMDCSDEEIIASVDYILENSQ